MKYVFVFVLLAFSACKKKEQEDPRRGGFSEKTWAAFQAMDFGCTGVNSDYFVKAELDGQPFCIDASGGDTCYSATRQVVVSGSLGEILPGYEYDFFIGDKESFLARTNRFTSREIAEKGELENEIEVAVVYYNRTEYPLNYILDSLFEVGRRYPLDKSQVIDNDPHGYFNLIIKGYYDISYNANANSLGGAAMSFESVEQQPSSAFLQVRSVSKREIQDYYLYDVAFEFSGDLYRNKDLIFKLTNGSIRGIYKVEK